MMVRTDNIMYIMGLDDGILVPATAHSNIELSASIPQELDFVSEIYKYVHSRYKDTPKEFPKVLPLVDFVHDPIPGFAYDPDMLGTEKTLPHLCAAVPEFGVHNSQIFSSKIVTNCKYSRRRDVS